MRRFLLILVPLLAASTAGADRAPDFAAVAADGEALTLAETARAQPTILFFWASWCPYCKALMPHLESIALEYGDDVRILAIQFRDDTDAADFIGSYGYSFTVIPDGDAIAARYGIHGTPGLVIADRDLEIRFDLRVLPRRDLPADTMPHARKAAFRAPFWAAEIRRTLDALPGYD